MLNTLPQSVGTNSTRQTPEQRSSLLAFVAAEYQEGRSLRERAELTGRTRIAVRRALDEAEVPRDGRAAPTGSTRSPSRSDPAAIETTGRPDATGAVPDHREWWSWSSDGPGRSVAPVPLLSESGSGTMGQGTGLVRRQSW